MEEYRVIGDALDAVGASEDLIRFDRMGTVAITAEVDVIEAQAIAAGLDPEDVPQYRDAQRVLDARFYAAQRDRVKIGNAFL